MGQPCGERLLLFWMDWCVAFLGFSTICYALLKHNSHGFVAVEWCTATCSAQLLCSFFVKRDDGHIAPWLAFLAPNLDMSSNGYSGLSAPPAVGW